MVARPPRIPVGRTMTRDDENRRARQRAAGPMMASATCAEPACRDRGGSRGSARRSSAAACVGSAVRPLGQWPSGPKRTARLTTWGSCAHTLPRLSPRVRRAERDLFGGQFRNVRRAAVSPTSHAGSRVPFAPCTALLAANFLEGAEITCRSARAGSGAHAQCQTALVSHEHS
jgi:hypothetical protein